MTAALRGGPLTAQLSKQHYGSVLQRHPTPLAEVPDEGQGSQQEPEHRVDNRGVVQRDVDRQGPLLFDQQPLMEHDLQGRVIRQAPPGPWLARGDQRGLLLPPSARSLGLRRHAPAPTAAPACSVCPG